MNNINLILSDEQFYNENIEKIRKIKALVKIEDTDQLRSILKKDSELLLRNVYRFTSRSLLSYAAEGGKLSVCEMLIELGADVNPEPETEPAPLQLAASEGHIEVVKLLVNAGAKVNGPPKGIVSPLMSATISGHADVAKFLLDAGADPNRFHLRLNETALDSSLIWQRPEIEKLLRLTDGVSMLEGIDWSNHQDGQFLKWIEQNFGRILPVCFKRECEGGKKIQVRLALANKKKSKIAFTTGIAKIIGSPVELSAILPDSWNPYDNSSDNLFPIELLAQLGNRAQRQKTSLEGTSASQADPDMSEVKWPNKLSNIWIGKRLADENPLMVYSDKVEQMDFFAAVPIKGASKKHRAYDPGAFQEYSFTKLTLPLS